MRDLHDNISAVRLFGPISVADNTAQTAIVDRLGYESLEFIILAGTIADAGASFTVLVEDGDTPTLTDAAAVSDDNLLGTEAGASFDQDSPNSVHRIGYLGSRRYVRLSLTPADNAAAALLAAVAVLGHPSLMPTTT